MGTIRNAVIPISKIKPHPENYNTHPDEQIAQLEASYEEFGQFNSIVVWQRPNGEYIQVARQGFLTGAKNKGAQEIRADILPEETDPMVVKRILIADNLHARNSLSHDVLLVQLLEEQQNAGYDLASLGTSFDELEALTLLLEQTTPKEADEPQPSTSQKTERPASVSVFLAVSSLSVIEEALAATQAQTRGEALSTICAFYLKQQSHETGQ